MEPYDGPAQVAQDFPTRYAALYDLDPELAVEHALDTLARLIMAKMSMDQCARTMQVGMPRIHAWRRLLRNRMKNAAKKVDIHGLMGSFFEELDELRAQGWRDVQSAQKIETIRERDAETGQMITRQVAVTDWKRRQQGANLVLRAQSQTLRILDMTGALDSAPLRSAIDAGEGSEGRTNALQQLAERFLSGGYKRGPTEVDGGEIASEEGETDAG